MSQIFNFVPSVVRSHRIALGSGVLGFTKATPLLC